jgi:hypothetical protein
MLEALTDLVFFVLVPTSVAAFQEIDADIDLDAEIENMGALNGVGWSVDDHDYQTIWRQHTSKANRNGRCYGDLNFGCMIFV